MLSILTGPLFTPLKLARVLAPGCEGNVPWFAPPISTSISAHPAAGTAVGVNFGRACCREDVK